jgi:hypothetical protein
VQLGPQELRVAGGHPEELAVHRQALHLGRRGEGGDHRIEQRLVGRTPGEAADRQFEEGLGGDIEGFFGAVEIVEEGAP